MLRLLVVAAGALALAACVPYRLGAADLLDTNALAAARGDVITPGTPLREAAPAPYRVSEERVAAPFGAIALTRVESDPRRPLVLFCGGSGFRQEVRGAVSARALSAHGDVWLFDYPGYGASGGSGAPAEFDALVTALAARIDAAYAQGRSGDLVLWGHSFGGGVCARLSAAVRTPSTLVLVGAFQSYPEVVRARANRLVGPLGRLIKPVIAPDMPDADIVQVLRHYRGGVLVAASREDVTVPFAASARLAERLRASNLRTELLAFEGGDHVAFEEWADFEPRMRRALATARADTGAAPASPAR